MQTRHRMFDEVSRLAGGAMGAARGVKEEIDVLVRQAVERLMPDLDLVSREEFEATQAMAAKARQEQEALKGRIEALEARLAGKD